MWNSEIIQDEVVVIGDSTTFHILVEAKASIMRNIKPACGNVKVMRGKSESTRMSVEKALGESKRPCKNCIKWLDRTFDAEVNTCKLCDRLSLLNSEEYKEYAIDYSYDGGRKVHVCHKCSVELGIVDQ